MRSKALGLSIVELMVVVLLGAMLSMGLFQVYAGIRRSDSTQNAFARIQEGGRLAMEMITRDIRAADYWGCMRQRDASHVLAIHNQMDTTDSDYVQWVGANPISGTHNVTSMTIGGKAVIAGTDVITLKTSMDLCAGQGRVVNAVTAGNLQVDTTCPVTAGQPALITTCSTGDLFTATAFNSSTGVISHDSTYNTGSAVKNASASLSQNYGAEAKLLTPLQRVYFIATGTGGISSLFRRDNNATAEELVSGVQNMQIQYGEDTNGDNAPDKYNYANAVTNMDNVRSIRITLTLISDVLVGPGTGTNNGFMTKSLTAVADIRNRSLQ